MNGLNVLLTLCAIGCYVLASHMHKKHAQSFYGSLIGGLAGVMLCLFVVANIQSCSEQNRAATAEWGGN